MPIVGFVTYTPARACYNPGDTVYFVGNALKTPRSDGREDDPDGPDEDDGPAVDVSDQISWRRPSVGTGSELTYVIQDTDVQHKVFGAYVGSVCFATVELNIVTGCPMLKNASDDAVRIAALLYVEGLNDGGGEDEQRAQAYVVVNRARYHATGGNGGFPSTVREVIEQPGQFRAVTPHSEYWNIADADKRRCLPADECKRLRKLLSIAEQALADPDGTEDPIKSETGKPAFFFNKSTKHHPAKADQTPLLRRMGKDGWTHSFWGSTFMQPR